LVSGACGSNAQEVAEDVGNMSEWQRRLVTRYLLVCQLNGLHLTDTQRIDMERAANWVREHQYIYL
jgi:hypothetical protein